MTILITGAGGLLAPYLVDHFSDKPVVTCARSKGDYQCDLSDDRQVADMIDDVKPATIIHAAAFTNVDGCQRKPNKAFHDNALAVARLGTHLPEESKLVLISTDQVYGNRPGPHREPDTDPVNSYGQTKLAGEWAALQRPNSLVLRANFFGPSRSEGRSSLSDYFVRAFTAKEDVTLFDDVFFSPLHANSLAKIVHELVAMDASGILNAGCREGGSKAEFGSLVAEGLGVCYEGIKIGKSVDMPGRAPRPLDLRMDVSELEKILQRPLPTMKDEIARLGLKEV